jgi:hypothetical protein
VTSLTEQAFLEKKNVIFLLAAKEPTLRYFAHLAKLLAGHSNCRPVFWGGEGEIARLPEFGLSEAYAIDFSSCTARPVRPSSPQQTARPAADAAQDWLTRMRKRIGRYSQRPELGLAQKVALHVANILRFRIKSKRILERLKPHAVCAYGDNHGLLTGDFLRLCNKAGVKVLHIPVSLSQQEIIAELRWPHEGFVARGAGASLLGRLMARWFPDQTLEYRDKLLFYHGLDDMLAAALTGCLTPKPWVLGMSRADKVLLSTDWEKAYWTQRGLQADKATVVGYYELEAVKARGFDPKPRNAEAKDAIVYNAPNFAEHNMRSWEEHWEIIEEHLRVLSGTGCDLVLVLHPKSSRAEYEWLEAKYACRIHRGPTAEALPGCSLYVTVASTTALWAASLGIRVLDLSQLYQLDVPLFRGVPRITMLSQAEEFKAVVDGAYRNGRRLREDGWYVDLEMQRGYLAQPLIGDALLRHIQ